MGAGGEGRLCYRPMPALSAEADPVMRILHEVRAIPPGCVRSYGAVGRRAGLPRGARQVARALAMNDDPQLPWHRVLRADGRIAFPAGSKGAREQARRLRAEGIEVRDGRVRMRAAGEGDLDAALWGPGAG
jgi:methylated-DNA-protein-cysteine methyltransferase related protein